MRTSTHRLFLITDPRGSLAGGGVPAEIPFEVRRYFVVFDVPEKQVRGEHAHRVCHQFMVCPRGSVTIDVDDGASRETVVLDRPDTGLYVPPMVWARQYDYSPGALLLVLASDPYDPNDYVRDYEEFRRLIRGSA